MFRPENVRAAIDSLNANVAVLDHDGQIIEVNDGWRQFGASRNARSDFVGRNYLQICSDAAGSGDAGARRVEKGLRRLLEGRADTYGLVYRCAERTFRMSARHLGHPADGVVVAHQDITALMQARRDRNQSRRELHAFQQRHQTRVEKAHEGLGQRLTAISLAAGALEVGGSIEDAIALIKLAVEEARQELKLLRYEARQRG